jgi:acyl carrier protein
VQDDTDATATFAPKTQGLAVLIELLGGTPLDFVALMGSINAVVPAPGVADYAAANMALDSFAEAGLHPPQWRRVFAVDWSAWAGVGMAANLQVPPAFRAAHETLLRSAIPPAVGVDMFSRILSSAHKRVLVTSYDIDLELEAAASRLVTPAPASQGVAADVASAPGTVRPELSNPYESPAAGAEADVAQIWTELIGVAGIGANDDFFELGGHSLLATRVLSRIGQTLGVQLTLRDFFQSPTPRGLAAMIEGALTRGSGTTDDATEREEFLL